MLFVELPGGKISIFLIEHETVQVFFLLSMKSSDPIPNATTDECYKTFTGPFFFASGVLVNIKTLTAIHIPIHNQYFI